MYFKNKKQDEAFEWIKMLDFDVLCLQEVPHDLLSRLKELPYHFTHANEGERAFATEKKGIPSYVVILSKYPFISDSSFAIPKPPNTRIGRAFMFILHRAFIDKRNAVFVDVKIPGQKKPVRIFSVHISLSAPKTRLEELLLTLTYRDPSQPTIICGDFNVIESFKCAPLNTMLGGPLRETLARRKERTAVEKIFAEQKFLNPLRGEITHPFSKSQLDHILVTTDFEVIQKAVVKSHFGSDHLPVFIETK
jgi:endonuclease/exonuclease/phosphatase family metal-dependent hydrolase